MSKGRPSAEREPRGSGLEAVFGRGANAFRRRFGFVAVAAIVLLVVLGAVLAWRQYDDSKQKALNDMHARVVLAATVFDTYFAGQLGTLSAIADSPSVVRTDTDQMATYFAAAAEQFEAEAVHRWPRAGSTARGHPRFGLEPARDALASRTGRSSRR